MSSNYTWDDSWFDPKYLKTPDEWFRLLFHTGSPEDAWHKLLNAPERGMPRFPLDADVTVGCKPLNGAGTRFELMLTNDGAHELHRCPVHLTDIGDRLYILGIIGRFQ